MRSVCALFIGLLLCAPVAARAEEEAKPSAEAPAAKKNEVTRADLAAAYLRFEKTLMANPPEAARLAEVNQGFDKAALSFFAGKNGEAIAAINELTLSLDPKHPPTDADRIALSLKITGQERIWPYANWTMAVYPRVVSLYPLDTPAVGDLGFIFRLRDESGAIQTFMEQPFKVPTGPDVKVDAGVTGAFADELLPAAYDVEIATPAGRVYPMTQWYVVPKKLKEIRAENEAKLAQVKAESPALQMALAACRARNTLLEDKPSETNSAQFLANPNHLIAEIEEEIAALLAGKDPYVRKTGDYWRVLPAEGREIPLRVYAPKIASDDKPMPLVIVLHGAGGDENMFMDAYGAGMIKNLADEHGFIVASPATNVFSANPGNYDRLLEALSYDYKIDEKKIYFLGHSMGAGAAAGWARRLAGRIAAACCIAGGNFNPQEKSLAPTLVIAAELDGVVPLARLKPGTEKAIEAGLPIELRVIKNYGHTIVVGAQLPDAVNWLLAH